jgi:pimeloyl-ACP methyl ester carboxylesterase
MTDFVVCGEVRVACEVHGSGPALVLMHGAEASRQMFASLVPALAPHFTVIAYDQRDCGETEGPPRAATLAELAGDAHALVKALGFPRAHVFGSSFGGRVAQAYALRHSDALDRLVLGSTWPIPHALAELNPQGVALIAELRARLPGSAEELAGVFFPAPFLESHPALRSFFAGVKPASDASRRRAEAVNSSIDGQLSDIQAATLLLAGELDRLVPPSITLGMGRNLRRSEQALLPGVGHATALQAPDAVAHRLIRFLGVAREEIHADLR